MKLLENKKLFKRLLGSNNQRTLEIIIAETVVYNDSNSFDTITNLKNALTIVDELNVKKIVLLAMITI